MYKHILEGAGDINWMAIFALVTFVLIFVIATVTILRSDKAFIDRMANLPLEDSQSVNSETSDRHEK
jgi:hypothetical protein